MAARACSSSCFRTSLWRGQPHVLAFHGDLLLLGQQRVDQERRRIRQFAAAQILLGNAGQQRVLLMELAHRAEQFLTRRVEPGAIHEPVLRLLEVQDRSLTVAAR